jgi:lipopolysaccharide export system permease protein
MLVAGLAQEAIRQGLGPEPILKLIPYAIPNALRFAVPGTILFATCSVYGRMSASNEITAIKSLGISPVKLIVPALILAFLVSLAGVWLNDLAVSWGRKGMQRVVLHSVEQIAYGLLRTQRSYSNGQFSISVKRVDGRKLILPTFTIQSSDDEQAKFVTAQEAELRLDAEKEVLSITLTNGLINVGDETTMVFPDTIEHEIPLALASLKGSKAGSPSACPLWRIDAEIKQQKADMQEMRQQMAAEAALQMMTGELDSLTDDDWRRRNWQLHDAQERLYRLKTEPWRRWATGFSCLFFVMVGAPLAIRMRNSDLWSSFAMCFLPILVIYYPLLAFGVEQAKSGDLPPCSVWVGNIIFGLVGFWLLRRTLRN